MENIYITHLLQYYPFNYAMKLQWILFIMCFHFRSLNHILNTTKRSISLSSFSNCKNFKKTQICSEGKKVVMKLALFCCFKSVTKISSLWNMYYLHRYPCLPSAHFCALITINPTKIFSSDYVCINFSLIHSYLINFT